jgi:hypothetical protein
MITFDEWVLQNHPEFLDEGRLGDAGRAAVAALGLLGGSGLPPYNVALGADAVHRERPAAMMHQVGDQKISDEASDKSFGVEKKIVNGKVAFNPLVGPKPSNRDASAYDIWKHQVRWHRGEAAKMRKGRHESPDHLAYRQYYTNPENGQCLFPDAPL